MIPFVKMDWDLPFIDYLKCAEADGFVDSQQLLAHRNALIKHIEDDNNTDNCPLDRWDKIRNKDLWLLSYHNEYFKINDMENYSIQFIEEYSKDVQKIIIRTDNEMEVIDNDV